MTERLDNDMSCCHHEKSIVTTEKAPKALGPYSAAVSTGCMVYTAGQIGIDPTTGKMVDGGIQAQTRQVLTNLKGILEEAGSGLDQIVKTTVFLQDMGEFTLMNEVYGTFFSEKFPARSTVQVCALPGGAAVEIEAVALLPCECEDH